MGASNPKQWIADSGLKQNDFKSMFKAWVMPYDVNTPVLANVDINHPVYIKLDLLIMAINHMCMLYDSPKSPDGKQVVAENQTPIIYMDFNTESNTCLSMPLHMSIDILKFMIPFRGTNEEYKLLFEDEVVLNDGKTEYIKRGGDEIESLFKPETEDHISGFLPDFKDPNNSSTGAWQGRIMNVLVNIDYLLNLCNSFSTNDDSHSVFLKPFMQQLVTDMAKSMGDVNLFRLAYSDKANCLYITDDQSSPLNAKETYASNLPPMLDSGLDGINVNSIELPLYGLTSIAKSVSIKTEVSTKLSNMLAISANSDKKSSASKDATPFGVYNLNFSDRYKPQAATVNQDVKKVTEGEIKAAGMFNSYVNSIFRTDQPQTDGTSQALNYYIDRMNNKKSERAATRASAMIPVSVDFTTDGISGFSMGHAFLLPEQMLPNTYARFNQSQEKRVGFVVVGLDHSIQANNWDTSVKANMFFMKNADDFYSDKKYFNFNPLAQAAVDSVQNSDTDQLNGSPPPVATAGTFRVTPPYGSLVTSAKNSIGTSTKEIPGTENGNIGCGAATSIIFLRATGKSLVPKPELNLGTGTIYQHLKSDVANWKKRDDWKNAKPGDIIVTARAQKAGHVGVVSDTLDKDGTYVIISNSSGGFRGSSPGTIQPNYSVKKWQSVANRNPTQTFAFEYIGTFS
jgi:hypothetical protein